ncbi:hypothetical protein FJT64_018587 [Amphibalanus amphitrite]|uniref:Uncharacterized protein n=1 Tax=Amphibalanus amphitrite TaxID=1232801 RepID=A0A6A4WU92_AMPAM|nr:hypothetical protein FJT64_018587 [Amphibalanus amphitrite]
MPQPDEGGIEAGLGRAAQPPTPTSSASTSSSRLQQPSPRSGSSCSAAELRQLEWDSSFDFTARYQPSRADGEPTERSEVRAAPGPLVTVTQQAQTVSVPAAVFAETEVNLVVASADSSRSDRTGSTVITLRRQVSFPTISLKRSAGALDGLRGLTILFEGGEQPDTAGSEASFCSLAPTEPQQPAASRHASRLSQQTEYASLSERLSSASAASHPAPPQPLQQQQTGHAAMSRPPRTPAPPPPPPLASRAPPSIEKCARWLARHELQVGHGDGTDTGPAAAAATIAAADGTGRARGAWRSRIQPCSSQDRVVSVDRQIPQPDYRPVVAPAEPRRAADTGRKRSPATARKALSDPLGGSAQSAGTAGSAAAAVRPQPAAKSRSAHAGTAAGMTRQQHAESLARRPRPPPVAAAVSRSYTETATAPSVPSLHYLDSAESDELIRRWRQDRKDFYQLAYLRRGDSDVLSPADDSGFSSSVLTQQHVSEQQVQVFTVSAVKTTPSAVPAASAASKLGPAQGDSAPVAAESEHPVSRGPGQRGTGHTATQRSRSPSAALPSGEDTQLDIHNAREGGWTA